MNPFISHCLYRVLYADTDTMGIVYNGNYFRFFEQARGEYLRQRKLSYAEVEARKLRTPLTEAHAHYYSPFKYDDLVHMECYISQVKRASFKFDYRLYLEGKPDETKVNGYTIHATTDFENKVVKIPDWLLAVL